MPVQQPAKYEDIVAEDIVERVVGGFGSVSMRKLILQAAREGFRKGIEEARNEIGCRVYESSGEVAKEMAKLQVEVALFPTRGPWAHVEAAKARA